MSKLQLAIDLVPLDDLERVVRPLLPMIEVVEAGTPLIKRHGLDAARLLRTIAPDHLLVADMKTMDAGALEAEMAFGAGADLMTVLACASDATISAAVEVARQHGKAVVADLIDMAVGRAQRTFQTLRLWSDNGSALRLRPAGTVRSRFYLRMNVEDRPGVLAEVARILAEHQISIASVIQHEVPEAEGQRVQMVILAHTAPVGTFRTAVARIDQCSFLSGPTVYYPVAD